MPTTQISIAHLKSMKTRGERIVCLTSYDASFANLLDTAGIDLILVGDSLGMILQGHETTLPVTIDHMVYHTACVARGRKKSFLVADLPFLTYATPRTALINAGRLLQEGGAQMVKLEGGAPLVKTVQCLTKQGIPVCAHLGLLPQSVHQLSGYRFQGRDATSAEMIQRDALALQDAGASLLILECVPALLAGQIRKALEIPVIGIGAGVDCDGQILVLYDLLGLNIKSPPRFSRNFLTGQDSLGAAIKGYIEAVRSGTFPAAVEILY